MEINTKKRQNELQNLFNNGYLGSGAMLIWVRCFGECVQLRYL